MIIRDPHIIAAGMVGLTALIGVTLYFRWETDGPGTHGGGEDQNRQVAAPMADTSAANEQPDEQRRSVRATISGTVRSEDGTPLAGATVCAMASSTLLSADDTRWPRCADSDADGRYVLADLFGVRHRVSASAAGHLPGHHVDPQAGPLRRSVELRPGGAARDVDLQLARGGVLIRGRVMDLRGRPIADARVSGGGSAGDTASVWGRTDGDGRYTLWVRPGTVTVSAHAPGMTIGRVTGSSEGWTFPLYLAPASTLPGRLLRTDGTPIPGAWVRASATGDATQTDAAGRFTLDALTPGVYTPWAEGDDWFGMAAEQVMLGLGEAAPPLVITGRPAVFVEGRIVLASGGAPCEDGRLHLREAVSGREIDTAGTAEGRVHVRGLLPGTYAVGVACGGTAAVDHPPLVVADVDVRDQTWEVPDGPRTLTDAPVRPITGITRAARPRDGGVDAAIAARAGGISGKVVDARGQPLVGALVAAQPEDAAVTVSSEPPQLTDAAGAFTLAGLGGDAYTITVHPPGGGEVRRTHVKPGEAPVLTYTPGGRVRGTVVVPGGGAPDSFAIQVVDTRSGVRRAETFIATGGAWGFDGLAPGSHEIHVQAREGVGVQALTLAAGETQGEHRIALVGAATLRGQVVDLAGEPVPALEVGLSSARGVVSDMRAVSDAAGRFVLTRVSSGPVFVTVGPAGGQKSPYAASRVAIDIPTDMPIVDLPAIRVARRRIAVGGARGDLGFTLAAHQADSDPLLADLEVATVRHAGPATLAGLRPRDEIVSVDEQDVRGVNRSLYATLTEVPAGTTVRLGLARGVTVAITASKRR